MARNKMAKKSGKATAVAKALRKPRVPKAYAKQKVVMAPAAMGRYFGGDKPRINYAKDGSRCIVSHKEYVAEVPGATAWTTTGYVVQPALQTMFVWLAAMAGNFEKYRFRKLRFCYETESATSQAGSVVFALDYDALDSAPLSKQAALSYANCKRSQPWMPMVLDALARTDAQKDFYYTRSGAVPTGADQKTYDLGQLWVGVQNSSGSTGELHVEYEIELWVPQANVNPPTGAASGSAGLTSSALLGSNAAYATGSNIGWALTNSSTFTCSIAGTYMFTLYATGSVITGASFGNTGTVTLSTSSNIYETPTAATVLSGFVIVRAQVGQTFIPSLTSATTVTATAWKIIPYADGLLNS